MPRIDESLDTEWNFYKTFRNGEEEPSTEEARITDAIIYEQVCKSLFRDGLIEVSEIIIQVKDGQVTLNGEVSERKIRQMAEDKVRNISGVKDVVNHLTLRPDLGLIGKSDGWPQ